QGVSGLVLSIYTSTGTLVGTSSTSTTLTNGSTPTKITNNFSCVLPAAGTYYIRATSGYGNIGGDLPSYPLTEASGTIRITGHSSGGYRTFNNVQFTRGGSATAPTPSTATVGSTNYVVTQTLNGCVSDQSTIAVNVTGSVGTP